MSTVEIEIDADQLIGRLASLGPDDAVSILDSGGVRHLGSHYLIAGISPVSVEEVSSDDPAETLEKLDRAVSSSDEAAVFTISYEFGSKLLGIGNSHQDLAEPDAYIARYDALVIHDYDTGKTSISGNPGKIDDIAKRLMSTSTAAIPEASAGHTIVSSNFSRPQYLDAIETIKENIRCGDTYQTNLTQRLTVDLPAGVSPDGIFRRLRRDNPSPFSAFIRRVGTTVISGSPERFFSVDPKNGRITTSPIKGTRPRGTDAAADAELRRELLSSAKDRAENTMIVDLLRNDLGRVCEYGSVSVEKLCELEQHPTLFHLVSTVTGNLRSGTRFSDILRALFPCGSITGAPKISTMKIIREIEPEHRGLSMGAIGYYVPDGLFGMPSRLDLSVAIRTLVIDGDTATFNVGGGVVIDSDPASEYDETLTKARALLSALGARLDLS